MVEWKISDASVDYPVAVAFMEERVAAIRAGDASELVWLLEHPPIYTAGTGARTGGLIDAARFPVYETGRGGEHTYHGPGQRVGYVMLDLKKRCGGVPDLRDFVQRLEKWIIASLAEFGIEGFTREGRIGVWVKVPGGEAKIAAQGIRVRQGVSYHGIAVNVHPDLSHFSGIVPCGIREFGVTSMRALGRKVTLGELDEALERTFKPCFAA